MLKNKSIFIGGIWHETNTYSNKKTFIKDFKSYQWHENKNLITRNHNTNTEIGGFLDVLNQKSLNVIPSLFTAAVPSGIVTKKTFLKIVNKIINHLDKGKIDGVLLALHGALVVENILLPELFLVDKIKKKLKKNIPIVATFDLHANLSFELFEICEMLIGYDTFPHVDMRARGREAALHLCKIIKSGKQPKKFFKKLPILTVPQMQSTNDPPMNEVMKSFTKFAPTLQKVVGLIGMLADKANIIIPLMVMYKTVTLGIAAAKGIQTMVNTGLIASESALAKASAKSSFCS